jgi:hypothetical protein
MPRGIRLVGWWFRRQEESWGRNTMENKVFKATTLHSGSINSLVIQERGGIITGPCSYLVGCDMFGQKVWVVTSPIWGMLLLYSSWLGHNVNMGLSNQDP